MAEGAALPVIEMSWEGRSAVTLFIPIVVVKEDNQYSFKVADVPSSL
jgi:hypothetical protein